jgi:NhaP-type Na+/H+ or K+/H+ antiporter
MFDLSGYHVLLAAAGIAIILAYWLPRFVSGREPAASGLLILLGLAAFALVPGMPAALDPERTPHIWERVSELALIVALFGTGLRIDRFVKGDRRTPTLRLLWLAMPLTIVAVALLGWSIAGLSASAALLIGAVLAPTDPVLASDVQVGPPMEGGEHPVRFTLTAEAGLNDGLSFPFVHLALIAAAPGFALWSGGLEWLARDVVYRLAVGAASGVGIGWLLGKILFSCPRNNPLADTASGVVAFAGILLCYGATELIEGYGFVACFVAGVTLRRVEEKHDFHRRLHDFSESIEHALTAVLLVALGAALPHLLAHMRWSDLAIALALILVIRPAIASLALIGTHLKTRERAVVAFYGVRGIGSIYYLAFATGHMPSLGNQRGLWAIVALTIVISTIIHGFSAGAVVERVTEKG